MVWDDAAEHDVASALGGLFLGGAAVVALVLWSTCSQHGHALGGLFEEPEDERQLRRHDGGFGRYPHARASMKGD